MGSGVVADEGGVLVVGEAEVPAGVVEAPLGVLLGVLLLGKALPGEVLVPLAPVSPTLSPGFVLLSDGLLIEPGVGVELPVVVSLALTSVVPLFVPLWLPVLELPVCALLPVPMLPVPVAPVPAPLPEV